MSTSSEPDDYTARLTELRAHMQHPTEYEKAFPCFLENFASDTTFVSESDVVDVPHLNAVIAKVAGDTISAVPDQSPNMRVLSDHDFYHGRAMAGSSIILLFYLANDDVGVIGVLPRDGKTSPKIGRFQLGTPLIRPEKN